MVDAVPVIEVLPCAVSLRLALYPLHALLV